MRKKLFIPGPVDVRSDVLEQMSHPMIGHRTKDASQLQESISRKLQKIMQTENTIILSTSSGSGLMEGAVRCFTARRAAVFSIGAFGDRWYKMCKANGIEADLFSSPLGQPTTKAMVQEALATGKYDLITITHNETATGVRNSLAEIAEVLTSFPEVIFCVDAVSSLGGDDIAVDALGIDVCITSTQKCLGLPPGMAIASVSDRAIKKAETIPNRGLYFDYVELYNFVKEKKYQYPSTPALSQMFALNYQLSRILEEGMTVRCARHQEMAELVRLWAKKNFALYSNPDYLSVTVTCVHNNRDIPFPVLEQKMAEQGYLISGGYGKLKDSTFRIAHMADTSREDIVELLDTLDTAIMEIEKEKQL